MALKKTGRGSDYAVLNTDKIKIPINPFPDEKFKRKKYWSKN